MPRLLFYLAVTERALSFAYLGACDDRPSIHFSASSSRIVTELARHRRLTALIEFKSNYRKATVRSFAVRYYKRHFRYFLCKHNNAMKMRGIAAC